MRWLFLLLLPVVAWAQINEDPFSYSFSQGPFQVQPGQVFNHDIIFQIPEDCYLYEEKTNLEISETDGLKVGPVQKALSEAKDDPFFGKTVPVFHQETILTVPIQMPEKPWKGVKTVRGQITYQGCSDRLCYRLMKKPYEVGFTTGELISKGENKFSIREALRQGDFQKILNNGLWFALLLALIGGILTDLTPCVWPMIPVTLAIIGIRKKATKLHNFLASLVLVLGMAVTYSILGMVSALLGMGLGFLFQSLVFLIVLEITILGMALSMLGLYEIGLPSHWQNKLAKISGHGYHGIFLIGMTLGLMAAPCVGPVVGPLLVFVASTKSLWMGFTLLLTYALGMGTLFIILGTFYGHFKHIRGGAWTSWIKKGMGVLMLLVAVYYGNIITAQIRPEIKKDGWVTTLKGLEVAKKEAKPTLIDFYALWCPPCKELDKKVFSQPEVRDRLKKNWVSIRIDCTQNTPACEEAVDRFGVSGWPTVIFLDANQKESEERLVGRVISAEEMLQILDRVENAH